MTPQYRMVTCLALLSTCLANPVAHLALGDGFDHTACWKIFDAGFHGVGDDPDGYAGAVFDGRYIYFVPHNNGAAPHGEVLRYDTLGDFRTATSWAAFDPGANGVGNAADGFWGGAFDGRYVYFVPFRNGSGCHGEVLRYDTSGEFADVATWAAFDPGANGVGEDPDGYCGAAFDGRYVYFAPFHNGAGQHGEVLRLDTTGDFFSTASWLAYDAGAHGVGVEYGYCGTVFDGRFVYFVPNCTNDNSHHGEVRRFDTAGEFTDVSSWAAYDPGANGVGEDPDGYIGGVFDGRYVYFAPNWRESEFHGQVLRYDTTLDFENNASWATFDPGDHGVGSDLDGYLGAVCDGQYVYFVPCVNNTGYHSNILRFDAAGDFGDPTAWSTFNPRSAGVTRKSGYTEAVFDGRHIYFAPNRWYNPHGQVLRFDTALDLGDLNCDGTVNSFDIDPFIKVLGGAEPYDDYYALYPDCDHTLADLNDDGDVNGFDIDPFVAALSGR